MQKLEQKFIAPLVRETLSAIFGKAFGIKTDVLLQPGPKNEFEYVSPSAMKAFNLNLNKKEGTSFGCKTVAEFAQKVAQNYFENDYIGSIQANEKGFLQIRVKDSFVEERVNSLVQDLTYPQGKKQKVVVDFSSPNIAKEMHVGHLRSTIIGESVCRILEYMGNEVVRTNHVGDWGTQFGMLIAYMREAYPDYETSFPDIRDLDGYYKQARAKFDSDPAFKKVSQETVVRLQAYDENCTRAWKMICQVSRDYFQRIYKRLNITIDEYGESFYNPFIPQVVEELTNLGLIQEDSATTKKGKKEEKGGKEKKEKKGEKAEKKEQKKEQKEEEEEVQKFEDLPNTEGRKAKCIFLEKFQIPLIVVKSDGGYNYDSTDLAAIKYRLHTIHADRIIYITDSGQREHFDMIIAAARKAGWLTTQRAQHMGFGCILGQDGKKFKTRGGKSIKLLDLLNEAKDQAFKQLKNREKIVKEEVKGEEKEVEGEKKEKEKKREQVFTALKPEEYEDAAEKLGMASIKYYDLKQNRISDYIFSFEKMLDPKGNTATYLIYAYVRICSIIRKSGLSSEQITQLSKTKPFRVTHPDERNLAALLIKFYDILQDSVNELSLNKLTDFIYDICVKVQENYKQYRIIGDENMESRVILCEGVRKVLKEAFYFVGIVPIDKI